MFRRHEIPSLDVVSKNIDKKIVVWNAVALKLFAIIQSCKANFFKAQILTKQGISYIRWPSVLKYAILLCMEDMKSRRKL